MVPVGISPDHRGNGIVSQGDLFVFTGAGRECKSAPQPRTNKDLEFDLSSGDGEPSRNSSAVVKKKPQKHISCSWRKLINFFTGHAPQFTKWTTSYRYSSRITFYTLFFVEASLRSIGDVVFSGNPFSGLMILTAMLISCPQVAFLGFVTLTCGIITATSYLQIPVDEVRGGVVLFNNFLAGTVIALLADEDVLWRSPEIVGVCAATGILTVIVWRGVNGLLASHLEFPLLTTPFHGILLLYILSGLAVKYKHEDALQIQRVSNFPVTVTNSSDAFSEVNITNEYSEMYHLEATTNMKELKERLDIVNVDAVKPLNWTKMLCGIALTPSQIFGTTSVITSMMIYSAILVYSPIMLLQAMMGAGIGTSIGACLSTSAEYDAIYSGSWGYNSLLTSAALGGFFLILNIHSWILSIVGSILTAIFYSAMIKCHVPALGIPFMLTTWLLLPSNSLKQPNQEYDTEWLLTSGPFFRLRLSQMTTPELHRILLNEAGNISDDKYKSNRPPTSVPQTGNAVLPL